MSKDDRRLWLGNWQGSEPADTVVIESDDEEPEPQQPKDHRRKFLIGAGVAALCGLGFILGTSGSDEWITSQLPLTQTQEVPTPQFQAPQQQAPQAPPGGFGGPDQTGSDAVRAARAALRQFPGQIERVTGDPTGAGGYIVHVIQADGNEVHVQVDGDFHVQGSDADQPPPSFGPGTSQ